MHVPGSLNVKAMDILKSHQNIHNSNALNSSHIKENHAHKPKLVRPTSCYQLHGLKMNRLVDFEIEKPR